MFTWTSFSSSARSWRLRIDWLRNLLGGILMGVGVTMTPGGNDVLILHAIPGGSPHALPAYAALLAGTAAALLAIRTLGGTLAKVECVGDVCRLREPAIPGNDSSKPDDSGHPGRDGRASG